MPAAQRVRHCCHHNVVSPRNVHTKLNFADPPSDRGHGYLLSENTGGRVGGRREKKKKREGNRKRAVLPREGRAGASLRKSRVAVDSYPRRTG